MPSPFPGMDPFLESQKWRDFHHSIISGIRDILMPIVRPRYVLDQLAAFEAEGIKVLYPHRLLCAEAGQLCRVSENGQSLYADDNHLSNAGAALMTPLLAQVLRRAEADSAKP